MFLPSMGFQSIYLKKLHIISSIPCIFDYNANINIIGLVIKINGRDIENLCPVANSVSMADAEVQYNDSYNMKHLHRNQ